jgi:hypothetical protein
LEERGAPEDREDAQLKQEGFMSARSSFPSRIRFKTAPPKATFGFGRAADPPAELDVPGVGDPAPAGVEGLQDLEAEEGGVAEGADGLVA